MKGIKMNDFKRNRVDYYLEKALELDRRYFYKRISDMYKEVKP